MKKIAIFIGGILILMCAARPSGAYVLAGPHVLELMIQSINAHKRLLVSQKLTLYDSGGSSNTTEFTETLRYDFPEAFRSDIVSENIQRIHVVSKGAALTVIDGKAALEPETRYDRYKDIILYNSRPLLEQRLSDYGVDVMISSLGRFQGQPVYVLGAQYPNETAPQIWLDKDTFRPLCWMITGKPPGDHKDSLEVRYLQWQKVKTLWYPMLIQFYQNDLLVREIHAQKVEWATTFSGDLFDIDHLRSIYQPDTGQAADHGDQEELNEVQKAIEKFKRIYE